MMKVQPYLMFEGRCEEAYAFYRDVLGAEAKVIMRFKDAPDQSVISPGSENKIMHMDFGIGDDVILASDGRCSGEPGFQGFSLTLSVADEAESQKIFDALGEGGSVRMPLGKTFFSPSFGMLADKFGVGWIIIARG
jgi:PhnB protein